MKRLSFLTLKYKRILAFLLAIALIAGSVNLAPFVRTAIAETVGVAAATSSNATRSNADENETSSATSSNATSSNAISFTKVDLKSEDIPYWYNYNSDTGIYSFMGRNGNFYERMYGYINDEESSEGFYAYESSYSEETTALVGVVGLLLASPSNGSVTSELVETLEEELTIAPYVFESASPSEADMEGMEEGIDYIIEQLTNIDGTSFNIYVLDKGMDSEQTMFYGHARNEDSQREDDWYQVVDGVVYYDGEETINTAAYDRETFTFNHLGVTKTASVCAYLVKSARGDSFDSDWVKYYYRDAVVIKAFITSDDDSAYTYVNNMVLIANLPDGTKRYKVENPLDIASTYYSTKNGPYVYNGDYQPKSIGQILNDDYMNHCNNIFIPSTYYTPPGESYHYLSLAKDTDYYKYNKDESANLKRYYDNIWISTLPEGTTLTLAYRLGSVGGSPSTIQAPREASSAKNVISYGGKYWFTTPVQGYDGESEYRVPYTSYTLEKDDGCGNGDASKTTTTIVNYDPSTNAVTNAVQNLGTPAARAGYKFTGWQLVSGKGKLSGTNNATLTPSFIATDFSTASSTPTIKVKATWQILDGYIEFDGNGADGGSTDKLTVSYANTNAVPLPANGFTREGYRFKNWYYKDTDGTKTVFNVGDDAKSVNGMTYGVTKTLYAEWEPIKYTIKYTLNGSTNSDNNPLSWLITDGSKTLSKPTKAHYDFVNWTIGENSVTAISNALIPYADENDTIEITANFTEHLYSIKYDINIPTTELSQVQNMNSIKEEEKYGIETTRAINNPVERAYWEHIGWYTKSSGGDKITSLPKDKTYTDTTLYAHYNQTKFDVTYKTTVTDEVEDTADITKTYETDKQYNYEGKLAFNKHGYTVARWKLDNKIASSGDIDTNLKTLGKNDELTSEHLDTKSYELIACYEPNKYTITIDDEGVTETLEDISYLTNVQDLLNSENIKPTKKGYTFRGFIIESCEDNCASLSYVHSDKHLDKTDENRYLTLDDLMGDGNLKLKAIYTRGEAPSHSDTDAVVTAHDFILAKDEIANFTSDEAIKRADAKAWSTKDPNTELPIDVDFSGLKDTKGTYEIKFSATSPVDNKENTVVVKIHVKDHSGYIIDPNDPNYDGGNSRDGKLSGNDFSYAIYADVNKTENVDLSEEVAKALSDVYVDDDNLTYDDVYCDESDLRIINTAKSNEVRGVYDLRFILRDGNTDIRRMTVKVTLVGLKSDAIIDGDGNITNKSYVTANSFSYGIHSPDRNTKTAIITEDIAISRANALGFDRYEEPTIVNVNSDELAAIVTLQESERVGTLPLTFTTEDGATLTINVTLTDMESEDVAGKDTKIYANDFTYGIYDENGNANPILTEDKIKELANISGIKDNKPLDLSEVTVDAKELIEAQENNESGTYKVTITGPDGTVIIIEVTLKDTIIDIDIFGDGSGKSLATVIVDRFKDDMKQDFIFYLNPLSEDAPMPNGTDYGVTKAVSVVGTNKTAYIPFGKLQFTSDDAGKTYEYTVTQETSYRKLGMRGLAVITIDKTQFNLTVSLYRDANGKILHSVTITSGVPKSYRQPKAVDKMSYVNKYNPSDGDGGNNIPDKGETETKATDETKPTQETYPAKPQAPDSGNGGNSGGNKKTDTKKDTTETSAASDENTKPTDVDKKTDDNLNNKDNDKDKDKNKENTRIEDGRTIYPGDDNIFDTEDDYYIDTDKNGKDTFIHRGEDGKFDTPDDYYYVDLPNGRKAKVFIGEDSKPFTRDDWYEADEGYIVYAGRDGIIGTKDDYYINKNGIKIYAGEDYLFLTPQSLISRIWNLLFGDNLGDWAQEHGLAAGLFMLGLIALFGGIPFMIIFFLLKKKKYLTVAVDNVDIYEKPRITSRKILTKNKGDMLFNLDKEINGFAMVLDEETGLRGYVLKEALED